MTDDAPDARLRCPGMMHHTGVLQLHLEWAGCRTKRASQEADGELDLDVWGRLDIIKTVVDRWDGEGSIEVVQ
jgi:hypothetical protein